MSNGDPLRVGLTQPPDNRASSATMLVHNGSAFGTQSSSFWVQRLGSPIATSALRGDNFSTGSAGGQTVAGVLGMIQPTSGGIGVLGTAAAGPEVLWGEIGVMGSTYSFGVVGQGLSGLVIDNGRLLAASTGVLGESNEGIGVRGTSQSGFGIIGESQARAGVTGSSQAAAGVDGSSQAAAGVSGSSQTGVGVDGTSAQGLAGVHGSCAARYGVYGESSGGTGMLGTAPGNAIQGVSNGPAAASIGVAGISDLGAGILGDSARGTGVIGRSARGTAGLFVGPVVIHGALAVTGTKSAAIRHPDGTHRAVFCVESPESLLEDFGEVELTGRSIRVELASDFAALIRRDGYQVFLTSYGPQAVYVRRRGRSGFEIGRLVEAGREVKALRVGYRIVARRGDVKTGRLPKLSLPIDAPRVAPLDLPKRSAKVSSRSARAALPAAPKVPVLDRKRLSAEAPPPRAKRRSR